ncbi:hypothetical protein BH24ACT3_BH24ACT3_07650 [soil metagenome]
MGGALVRPMTRWVVAGVLLLVVAGCGVDRADVRAAADDGVGAPTTTQPPDPEDGPTEEERDEEAADDEAGDDEAGDEGSDDAQEPAGEDGDIPRAERPGRLGDDPELDELAQECFRGDLASCDRLYLSTDIGSDYEAYGSTCGGRNEEVDGGCVDRYEAGERFGGDVLPRGEPPIRLGNNRAFDRLADDCFDGDLEACDELYLQTPVGSRYEAYGGSCAGRQDGLNGDCERFFASVSD